MDARKIADSISLDLLVEGKARPQVLLPQLSALRHHVDQPRLVEAIRRLEKALESSPTADGEEASWDDAAYAQAIQTIDLVRRHLETAALTTTANATAKDATPPRETAVATSEADAPVVAEATATVEASAVAITTGTADSRPPPAPSDDPPSMLTYDTSCDRTIQQAFFAEASEHLLRAEHEVLHLENNPEDRESLDALFRAMHSLKGISGYVALKSVRQLAHESEAILARARTAPGGLGRAECAALLLSVDLLAQLVSAVQTHSEQPQSPFPPLPPSHGGVLAQLRRLTAQTPPTHAGPGEAHDLPAPDPGTKQSLAGPPPSPGVHKRDRSGLVRVRVAKLDRLIDAIGELVLTQSQVSQDPLLAAQVDTPLQEKVAHMATIARDLHSIAMSLRMVPLRDTFGPLTRIARDLAREQGKDVEVAVHGSQTELDKGIVDGLTDPLTHLIRNAVDHGIETPEKRLASGKSARGRIALSARHRAGEVIIEVADDGNGVDPAKILAKARQMGLIGATEEPPVADLCQLIFRPGFSTATAVTSVSGRGVGLDVVRGNVEMLGGRLYVTSEVGRHTTFTLSLPLTLAILDGLSVRAAAQTYLVPVATVAEILRPSPEQIVAIPQAGESLTYRGRQIRLVRLRDLVARTPPEPVTGGPSLVIVIETHNDRYGLMVDALLGHHQVLLKSLGEPLTRVKGIAGGAILGDGRVCLVLDVATLGSLPRPETMA